MKFVISIIRKIIPEELPRYLGRWRIEYCKMKINNKVDLTMTYIMKELSWRN